MVFTATLLAQGYDLYLNHLHFNFVLDLNNTQTDINDDRVSNPFDLEWSDFPGRDTTPPIFHNLYVELTNGVVMEVLNYPIDYSSRFSANVPANNYYQISYGNPIPDEIPRVLIRSIGTNSSLAFILQATDDWPPIGNWTGTGLTPKSISVYLDQNTDRLGNLPYSSVDFNQIHNTGTPHQRPSAEIVYNTEQPLQTVYGTSEQYYRLYRHPTNTELLPNQIVNDALNIDSGEYSEEGMHHIEIILKSESVNTDAINPQQTTTGVLYFYLLKNNGGGDNSYLDLAQSSPSPSP